MFVVVEELLESNGLSTGKFVVLDTEDKTRETYSYDELIHFVRDLKAEIKGVYLNCSKGLRLWNSHAIYRGNGSDIVCVWSKASDVLAKLRVGERIDIGNSAGYLNDIGHSIYLGYC